MKNNAKETIEVEGATLSSLKIGQVYKKSFGTDSRELVICEIYTNSKHPYIVAYDRRRRYLVKIRLKKKGANSVIGSFYKRVVI